MKKILISVLSISFLCLFAPPKSLATETLQSHCLPGTSHMLSLKTITLVEVFGVTVHYYSKVAVLLKGLGAIKIHIHDAWPPDPPLYSGTIYGPGSTAKWVYFKLNPPLHITADGYFIELNRNPSADVYWYYTTSPCEGMGYMMDATGKYLEAGRDFGFLTYGSNSSPSSGGDTSPGTITPGLSSDESDSGLTGSDNQASENTGPIGKLSGKVANLFGYKANDPWPFIVLMTSVAAIFFIVIWFLYKRQKERKSIKKKSP
jgi:hypothetical protein